MSDQIKLGTIPTGNEGRDAVHVAIIPVQSAAYNLTAGMPVKLTKEGKAIGAYADDGIGIVDPFRIGDARVIENNQWFWLCLYPRTITNLQHVWEQPEFPALTIQEKGEMTDREYSERWLRNYADRHIDKDYIDTGIDEPYDVLLNQVRDKNITYLGQDMHSYGELDDAEELFKHLSVVLGMTINKEYFEYFSCSC